jgi:hypothetical protein
VDAPQIPRGLQLLFEPVGNTRITKGAFIAGFRVLDRRTVLWTFLQFGLFDVGLVGRQPIRSSRRCRTARR